MADKADRKTIYLEWIYMRQCQRGISVAQEVDWKWVTWARNLFHLFRYSYGNGLGRSFEVLLKGIQKFSRADEIRYLKPSQALDVGEVSITNGRRRFMMSWKLKCLPWPCSTGQCEALLRSVMLRKFRRQRRQRQPEEGSQGPRGQNLS